MIIQKPVYYPFKAKIEANGRVVANNALIRRGNTYVMDYEDLEKRFADPQNKRIILCSPIIRWEVYGRKMSLRR